MLKKTIAIFSGILVALLLLVGIEEIGNSFYPIPKNLDYSNVEAMKFYVKNLPYSAFLFITTAHFFSAFTGSLTTSFISNTNGVLALLVGGLVFLASITNVIIFPFQPIWFVAFDIIVTAIGAWLAFKIAFNHFYHSKNE